MLSGMDTEYQVDEAVARSGHTFCLAMVCLVESNSECRRMLFQGAVRIDGY